MYAIQQYYKVMLLGVGWGVVLLHHDGIMFTILHNNNPPPPSPFMDFPHHSLLHPIYTYMSIQTINSRVSFLHLPPQLRTHGKSWLFSLKTRSQSRSWAFAAASVSTSNFYIHVTILKLSHLSGPHIFSFCLASNHPIYLSAKMFREGLFA